MKEQSQLLTDFYRAYLEFAEEKANPFDFQLTLGLCSNLRKFFKGCENSDSYYDTSDEMYQQFDDAGLDQSYPFNLGYVSSYTEEMRVAGAAKNEMRTQWVRNHAKLDEL